MGDVVHFTHPSLTNFWPRFLVNPQSIFYIDPLFDLCRFLEIGTKMEHNSVLNVYEFVNTLPSLDQLGVPFLLLRGQS